MLCQLQYMYSTLMYICRILKPNCNSYYFNIVNPVIFLSYIFYSYWGVCCPSDRPVKGCDSNLGQVFYCRGRDTDHLTNTPPPLAHYTSTRPQHLHNQTTTPPPLDHNTSTTTVDHHTFPSPSFDLYICSWVY